MVSSSKESDTCTVSILSLLLGGLLVARYEVVVSGGSSNNSSKEMENVGTALVFPFGSVVCTTDKFGDLVVKHNGADFEAEELRCFFPNDANARFSCSLSMVVVKILCTAWITGDTVGEGNLFTSLIDPGEFTTELFRATKDPSLVWIDFSFAAETINCFRGERSFGDHTCIVPVLVDTDGSIIDLLGDNEYGIC